MSFLQELIFGLVLPAALSGVACLAGARIGRRREGFSRAGALAVGLGYIAAHAFLIGRAVLQPLDVQDRLPGLVLGAIAAGAVEASVRVPRALRWAARVVMVGATVVVILGPMIRNAWDGPTAAAWLAATGAGMLLLGSLLARLADREPGIVVPWALGLAAAALAPALVVAHSLVLGRLAGAFAVTLAPVAIAAARAPQKALARGLVPVAVVLLAGLTLVGRVYADLPGPSVLLLALAPLAAWVVRIGPIRRRARWAVVLACTLAVLVPAGAAIVVAAVVTEANPEGY